MPRTRIEYGPEPQQFGHFYAPEGARDGPVPVVMVIHGGYWSGQYHLNLGTSFAVELARSGVAVWNIEYRRIGAGGRWPKCRPTSWPRWTRSPDRSPKRRPCRWIWTACA